ncbi:hypothetical protein BRADI_3g19722v3 [Brachypodium distachyon]|uniref:Uncharacterized protein n=1 Tax=Brachypodium distachyon TaxID=15368 RepID=A0A0Q3Q2Q5_BRADI|nr:hypothetical protein BRADI_3g19722v3 [Brachypodium distachyon]
MNSEMSATLPDLRGRGGEMGFGLSVEEGGGRGAAIAGGWRGRVAVGNRERRGNQGHAVTGGPAVEHVVTGGRAAADAARGHCVVDVRAASARRRLTTRGPPPSLRSQARAAAVVRLPHQRRLVRAAPRHNTHRPRHRAGAARGVQGGCCVSRRSDSRREATTTLAGDCRAGQGRAGGGSRGGAGHNEGFPTAVVGDFQTAEPSTWTVVRLIATLATTVA